MLIETDRGVRFYSLARHALLQALKMSGVVPGQRILMPEFICRDLLAPLAMVQATPVWYAVDERLQPADSSDRWPVASAVLAVNYFGFPQDLTPFRAYAARTGALLIEDNAHGFLSQDADGNWLGSRAPYGLFSIRKTLRIPDGAALMVNDLQARERMLPPLRFDGTGLNPAQRHKARMRRIPIFGDALLRMSTALARRVRKLSTGSEMPQPDPHSEIEFPAGASPWSGLRDALRNVDADAEIRRRRQAYAACVALATRAGVDPVFKEFPAYCVPYGFPFRSDPAGLQIMQGFADQYGYDLVTWPDLPGAIIEYAPEHYRNVLMVNFLW
ncbi:MAG: DegT/DnrJ/EryC1/StrS aminotransferase family protein [Betaproteobacteria bacterium]|nr:DegT/DnrJ/EryC1/StrS aminotransferase family protein [Betaproteobacteria bacterium]